MPPASSPSKRTYESAVRREQLEQTRERIVDALVEQVWEERLTDFSVPKVAKRAGVSTRTVYRHFPTRDDLLDAVGARLIDRAPHPAPPESFDEMPAYTGRLFDWFAKNRRAVAIQQISDVGRDLHRRNRSRRLKRVEAALAELMPDEPDPKERMRRYAPFRLVVSSHSWLFMTTELGLSHEAAKRAAMETVATLVAVDRKRSKGRKKK